MWDKLPSWMKTLRLYKKDLTQDIDEEETFVVEEANLISSYLAEYNGLEYHLPVLDLDVEHHYIESSTFGHGHLIINKPLTKEKYDRLLNLLLELGIIEQGILDKQWNQSGKTFIRMPGIKKQPEELSSNMKNTNSDML